MSYAQSRIMPSKYPTTGIFIWPQREDTPRVFGSSALELPTIIEPSRRVLTPPPAKHLKTKKPSAKTTSNKDALKVSEQFDSGAPVSTDAKTVNKVHDAPNKKKNEDNSFSSLIGWASVAATTLCGALVTHLSQLPENIRHFLAATLLGVGSFTGMIALGMGMNSQNANTQSKESEANQTKPARSTEPKIFHPDLSHCSGL